MTFWDWLDENRTKSLGFLVATAGFVSTTIAAGTFMDLLEPNTVKWLGLLCGFIITVLGGGVSAVGYSNTGKIRVAEAQAETARTVVAAVNAPAPDVPIVVPPSPTPKP